MNSRLYNTDKGQVIRSIPDNEFIIEFGNLSWRLSIFQFRVLKKYIHDIDGNSLIKQNENSLFSRKIRIPIKKTNMSILLNEDELLDFKSLLSGVPNDIIEKDDLFEKLYQLADDRFERFERIKKARIVRFSLRTHLN
jgi:hypothetical protein